MFSHLQTDDEEEEGSDAVHHAPVVGDEGLAAAAGPDVELLRVVVVVVVGRVVGQVVLDAGAWGAGVAAAEGDAVHQILPLHVAQDTTGVGGGGQNGKKMTRVTIMKRDCFIA